MYHSDIKLKEGAFVVSDAHYSHKRPHFLNFLKDIQSKKLQPTQLILMGDIFDALFGGIKKTSDTNQEGISIINEISKEIEVVYLEGNHDFNLTSIFPHAKVFPIYQQPLACGYKEKKIILAHGDYDGAFGYKIYTSLIRNKIILKFLNLFDEYILNKLDIYLNKKDDCKELDWFDSFIKNRFEGRYECDYFIEGHFHQNKAIKISEINYINLGAFACNQRYFTVKSSEDIELLEENIFSKET
ncbi:UDP-2,3-diacylglucosamine diphosphatase [Sulfurimonas sp.]